MKAKFYIILNSVLIKVIKLCSSYKTTLAYAKNHRNVVLVSVIDGFGQFSEVHEAESCGIKIIYTTEGLFAEDLIQKERK